MDQEHSTEQFVFSPNFAGARTSIPIPKIVTDKQRIRINKQSERPPTRNKGKEKFKVTETMTVAGNRYNNSLENDQCKELSITCRKNRATRNFERLQIPRGNISLVQLESSKEQNIKPLRAEYKNVVEFSQTSWATCRELVETKPSENHVVQKMILLVSSLIHCRQAWKTKEMSWIS